MNSIILYCATVHEQYYTLLCHCTWTVLELLQKFIIFPHLSPGDTTTCFVRELWHNKQHFQNLTWNHYILQHMSHTLFPLMSLTSLNQWQQSLFTRVLHVFYSNSLPLAQAVQTHITQWTTHQFLYQWTHRTLEYVTEFWNKTGAMCFSSSMFTKERCDGDTIIKQLVWRCVIAHHKSVNLCITSDWHATAIWWNGTHGNTFSQ